MTKENSTIMSDNPHKDDEEKIETIMSIKSKKLTRKPSFQIDPNAKQNSERVLAASGLDQLANLSLDFDSSVRVLQEIVHLSYVIVMNKQTFCEEKFKD